MSGTHSIFAGAGMLGLATAFATSLATSLACSSNDTPRGGDIPPLPPPLGTENASVCANFMGTTADPTVPWVEVTLTGTSGKGTTGSFCVPPGQSPKYTAYVSATNYCDNTKTGYHFDDHGGNADGTIRASGCSTVVTPAPTNEGVDSYVQPYACWADGSRSTLPQFKCNPGCSFSCAQPNNWYLSPEYDLEPKSGNNLPYVTLASDSDDAPIQLDGWVAVPWGFGGDVSAWGGDPRIPAEYTDHGPGTTTVRYGMTMGFPNSCFWQDKCDTTKNEGRPQYSNGFGFGNVCYKVTGSTGNSVNMAVMDTCFGTAVGTWMPPGCTPGENGTCDYQVQPCCDENGCPVPGADPAHVCDWCHENEHMHFDMNNAAWATLCTGGPDDCILTDVEPFECHFAQEP